MPDLHVNDSGTFRTAADIHINDSGTFRTVQEVYVNDAGTWRLSYSAGVAVNAMADFTANCTLTTGTAIAQVQFLSDGTTDRTAGTPVVVYYDDWTTDLGAFVNSEFEVRATLVSGTSPAGLSMNTWYGLGSNRVWTMGRSSTGTTTGVVDFEIREISNTVNTETVRVTLAATIFNPI